MTKPAIRILLLADTHLGFDAPLRPRVERRRRGPDFFSNYEHALRPARRGEVDLVVHGGDLFFRRRVPPLLVERALEPLAEVAQKGVPVFLVPGNHEGSRIPLHLATATPNLTIFHQPGTFVLELAGVKVGLSGFPFARKVGGEFKRLIRQCGYSAVETDFRLLCLHQSVEGARVGPHNYTFRIGPEVMTGQEIPGAFDAVLAGHIHRSQLLTHDLAGRKLPAPVIYPGSIERTSFAERNETKHYAIVTLRKGDDESEPRVKVEFESLPSRPMVILSIDASGLDAGGLKARLGKDFAALDPDAVVQVRFNDPLPAGLISEVNTAMLRSLAPSTMNVILAFSDRS